MEAPPLEYEEPDWSALPPSPKDFSLACFKSGSLLEPIAFPPDKRFLTIGRLPLCDIPLDHPSLSRYHAILQWKGDGTLYLYDLNSRHGTKHNKKLVPPHEFIPLRVGDWLTFGASTRSFILQGPETNMESEHYVESAATFCDWGMRDGEEGAVDDGNDVIVLSKNANFKPKQDAPYFRDPRKYLRQCLDAHGFSDELDFEHADEGSGSPVLDY